MQLLLCANQFIFLLSDSAHSDEPLLPCDTPQSKLSMPGRRQLCYSIYVLLLLVIAYLLNQLDRYTLGIVTKPMSRDLEYGDQACFRNSSLPSTVFKSAVCNATTENT